MMSYIGLHKRVLNKNSKSLFCWRKGGGNITSITNYFYCTYQYLNGLNLCISCEQVFIHEFVFFFCRQEMVALETERLFNDAIIEEREQGIQEIQQQIGEVHEIFKDLAVLVHEQGIMIGMEYHT